MIIIIILFIASLLVISWTFFFSIDEIKKLEKKKIGKIISIVFKQFFKNLWSVIGIILFLLAWYIAYNLLNN